MSPGTPFCTLWFTLSYNELVLLEVLSCFNCCCWRWDSLSCWEQNVVKTDRKFRADTVVGCGTNRNLFSSSGQRKRAAMSQHLGRIKKGISSSPASSTRVISRSKCSISDVSLGKIRTSFPSVGFWIDIFPVTITNCCNLPALRHLNRVSL